MQHWSLANDQQTSPEWLDTSDLPSACGAPRDRSVLHQHGEGQQQAEEQSAGGASSPGVHGVGAQEGGLFDVPWALAVPQVGAHAGGVAHGVGQVALLLDALEEVGHGPAGQHSHILAAVRGGLSGDGGLLDVVFALWETEGKYFMSAELCSLIPSPEGNFKLALALDLI